MGEPSFGVGGVLTPNMLVGEVSLPVEYFGPLQLYTGNHRRLRVYIVNRLRIDIKSNLLSTAATGRALHTQRWNCIIIVPLLIVHRRFILCVGGDEGKKAPEKRKN